MPEGHHSPEVSSPSERPCFPVQKDTIDTLKKGWLNQTRNSSDIVESEEDTLQARDPSLAEYFNMGFGLYQEKKDVYDAADRGAYVTGALFVDKALSMQGTVPRLPEDPAAILAKEERAYETLATTENVSPHNMDELAELRLKNLARTKNGQPTEHEPLVRALLEAAKLHPERGSYQESFLVGAAMSLFPRLEALKNPQDIDTATNDLLEGVENMLKKASPPSADTSRDGQPQTGNNDDAIIAELEKALQTEGEKTAARQPDRTERQQILREVDDAVHSDNSDTDEPEQDK